MLNTLLYTWLKIRAREDSLSWLNHKIEQVSHNISDKILFTSFSSVPRHFNKQNLNLSTEELARAQDCIPGWNPSSWTLEQIARSLLLLALPAENKDHYISTLDKIIGAADVEEAIAFYQSLPLLSHPEQFQLRAAEGIRSNMTSVFNAVAHNNPYAAKYLDDLAWNQMILKALFVDTPLHPIYGLRQRNNQQLSQMLIDYARERIAANRTVSPELWPLVLPFQPEIVEELKSFSCAQQS